jgi:TetR/AcrR family transcriptional regulator
MALRRSVKMTVQILRKPKQRVAKAGRIQSAPSPRRGRPSLVELENRLGTRSGLILATSELMIAKDSVEISLSEIAKVTGQNQALVKYHFGNKEGLLMALVEQDAAMAVKQLNELKAMELPVDKKLRMHIGGIINTYFKAPYLNRLLHHLMQNSTERNARRVNEIFVEPIAVFYSEILKQGYDEGLFREIDPMDFYFILVGASDHFFSRRRALSFSFDVDNITEELKRNFTKSLVDIVMNGILIHPS